MDDYVCEFCILRGIRRRAKREKRLCTVLEEGEEFNVYVHPPEIHPNQYGIANLAFKEEHYIRSFARISKRCSCDERRS